MFGFSESPGKRVGRGTKWLDENRPGWAAMVSADKLDLSSPENCVLGQVYGLYYEAPPIASRSGRERYRWTVRHGFDRNNRWLDSFLLESEWEQVLEVRRGAEILGA